MKGLLRRDRHVCHMAFMSVWLPWPRVAAGLVGREEPPKGSQQGGMAGAGGGSVWGAFSSCITKGGLENSDRWGGHPIIASVIVELGQGVEEGVSRRVRLGRARVSHRCPARSPCATRA